MTEQELSKIYYLEQSIKRLRYRLAEITRDGVNKEELTKRLTALLDEQTGEELRLRTYISNIQGDEEIKAIMEMRFIYLMRWEEIGEELHMDRTTASKKMRKYLREN